MTRLLLFLVLVGCGPDCPILPPPPQLHTMRSLDSGARVSVAKEEWTLIILYLGMANKWIERCQS